MMRVSDYVMQFLARKGVRQVFMLPGGGAMHLDDSLGRSPDLEYVCFLHEQALAIAVEACGQFTNTPGVGLVTSGPGSTNTVTGVTAAYFDSTPCLFLSGQAKRADLKGDTGVRQRGPQEVDIVSMISGVTKYAVMVMEPESIRYHLERAWHEATSGRMGPVWLDIPLDVQGAAVDEEELKGFTPANAASAPDPIRPDELDECIARLNRAERPALLIGNGVKLAGAGERIRSFAEEHQLPMLLTWKTIDFLDSDHPLNMGAPGIMGARYANFIVQNCDLLLILGSRLDSSLTAFDSRQFARHADKIMVDIDPCEIRKLEGIARGIVADAKRFGEALHEAQPRIERRPRTEWLSYCQRLKSAYPVVHEALRRSPDGINLYAFTESLCERLTSADIITPESSGAAGEITYQAMRVKAGQLIKNAAGLGSMGFGLPYAIGACLATGRRRTILLNGDGAFQLNLQELEVVRRLALPIKAYIFDNDGYASIRATQDNLFDGFHVGSSRESGLTLPPVRDIARAYGIRYEEADDRERLAGALDRSLADGDPVICRIRVTPAQTVMPRVKAMKLPDGSMQSKPLEDMWPYLAAEELAANMIAEG